MDPGLFDDLVAATAPVAAPVAQQAPNPAVYGAGAPETGQAGTPEQRRYYAAAGADRSQPEGSTTNPTYDTATITGTPDIAHVTTRGQLSDPNPQVDLFGDLSRPAFGARAVDTRPASESLGAALGANTVAKSLLDTPNLLPMNTLQKAGIDTLLAPFRSLVGNDQSQVDQASKTQRPGVWGKILGEVGLTAPMADEELGSIPLGAMQGYMTSDAKDPMGKAADTLAGAIGGKLGDLGIAGVKNIISPQVRPVAQWAMDHGIRITPGTTLGGIPEWMDGVFRNGPIVGAMARGAQDTTLDDFGRATYNKLMTPAGIPALPPTIPAGNAANAAAHKAFSAAYDKVLPSLTLTRDAPFEDGLSNLQGAGAKLGPMQGSYDALMQDGLSRFDPNGQMNGTTFKDFDTELGQEARAASRDPALMSQKYGNAVQDLQSHFRDLLERSNPDQAPQLTALNKGYAGLVTADKAATAAATNEGRFTPDGLIRAGRATDYSNRKTSTAAGEAMLQDWANEAKANGVPNAFPKSPGLKGLMALLPELIVGAGVTKESSLLPGVGTAAAMDALLAGLYTKPAMAGANALLTKRPAAAKTVGDILKTIQPIGAYAGGTAAPTLLPQAVRMLPDFSQRP